MKSFFRLCKTHHFITSQVGVGGISIVIFLGFSLILYNSLSIKISLSNCERYLQFVLTKRIRRYNKTVFEYTFQREAHENISLKHIMTAFVDRLTIQLVRGGTFLAQCSKWARSKS